MTPALFMRGLLLVSVLEVAFACSDSTPIVTARIRGPQAMVAAGSNSTFTDDGSASAELKRQNSKFLYIAGGVNDSLYVLDLTLGDFGLATIGQMVRAKNKFFPLEIPVGRFPRSLETSYERAYVLALSGLDNTITVIDADSHLLVRVDNAVLKKVVRMEMEATPKFAGGATMMIADPQNTEGHERYYVANAPNAQIHVVELGRDGNGVPNAINVVRVFDGVGAIERMVISPDGRTIFGSDASSPFLHRIDTDTGASTKIDVGGVSLDVALVGSKLFVARPDTSSVEVFDARTGAHINQNAQFVSPLLPDDEEFEGIYMFYRDVPTRLYSVTADAGTQIVTMCLQLSADGTVRTVDGPATSTYLMVATDAGRVYFIDTTDSITYPLIDISFCVPPVVQAATAYPNPFDPETGIKPFVPCTSSNPRVYCDSASGVSLSKGNVGATAYTLVWEGSIAGAVRTTGGGGLSDDGIHFFDVGVDWAANAIDIQAGDLLILVSPPNNADPSCADAYGADGDFDKRGFSIIARETLSDGRQSIVLDPAVRSDCFSREPGRLSYVVRAQNAFTATEAATGVATVNLPRLHPGDKFGDQFSDTRFQIRADIATAAPAIQRDQVVSFVVQSTYQPMIGGKVPVSGGPSVPAGRLPTGIITARIGALTASTGHNFVSLVSYAGSDSIVVFDPTSSVNLEATSTSTGVSAIVLR